MNQFVLEDEYYTLPAVYTTTKSGKTNYWKIYVKDDYYYTISYLLPNGKPKMSASTKCKPKNVGKSNETTAHQQALLDAYHKWCKKNDKKIECMLAQKYTERGIKYLTEPFAISPKLDGIRAIAQYENDTVQLYSRNGKPFTFLDTLKKELTLILQNSHIVLDGELYSHEIPFNELSGIARATRTKSEKDDLVEYWIFDMISDQPYSERIQYLKNIIPKHSLLKVVDFQLSTHAQIYEKHQNFVEQGFEGLIARELNKPYEIGVRSNYLLKYKEFQDEEYEIIGYKSGVGNDQSAIIFECRENEHSFFVRPRGSLEYRKQLYKNGEQYIGKKLTVRYQEKDIVPRFPVGIDIRDYE